MIEAESRPNSDVSKLTRKVSLALLMAAAYGLQAPAFASDNCSQSQPGLWWCYALYPKGECEWIEPNLDQYCEELCDINNMLYSYVGYCDTYNPTEDLLICSCYS